MLYKWNKFCFTVEKVTVLARFLETDGLQNNQVIQTALAHAFCLLIGSVEDINAAVAQRATQYLETIKYAAIKVFFILVFLLLLE